MGSSNYIAYGGGEEKKNPYNVENIVYNQIYSQYKIISKSVFIVWHIFFPPLVAL
jgi:hypothetical protein